MAFRDAAGPNDVLLVATGRQVVAADPSTGKILWRHTIGASKGKSIARMGLLGEQVVVARDEDLHCLDQRTGEVLWKAESPIAVDALIVSTSRRIFVARGGEVACFDEGGKQQWHEVLGSEGAVSLAIDGVVLQADQISGER